jgi:hypothetical protein
MSHSHVPFPPDQIGLSKKLFQLNIWQTKMVCCPCGFLASPPPLSIFYYLNKKLDNGRTIIKDRKVNMYLTMNNEQ